MTTKVKPTWAAGYEAGYRVGYRHGMTDARTSRSAQPTPAVTRSGDVSGTRDDRSSAVQSRGPA